MTRLLNTLFINLLTFLLIISGLETFAQCANFEIVYNKTDVCAPEVIKYYVTNAPSGSLFEWDVAAVKFFGGDTIYQSHINPSSFKDLFSFPVCFVPITCFLLQ